MSDNSTKRLLRPFVQMAPAPLFLSGFFQSPPENFHTSEEVEIDIQRDGEDVAVAIQNIGDSGRVNENSTYSNKTFKPPIFKEIGVLGAQNLMKREPGNTPFTDFTYEAIALQRAARLTGKLQNKIRRSIEMMSSQVLQTGQLTLVNQDGVAVYTLNFQPKSSHFAPVGTNWAADGSGGDRLEDLAARASLIRQHGHRNPDVVIMGATAWHRFIASDKVRDAFKRDGLGLGQLAPQRRGAEGATFQGYVWAGSYRFEVWTYNGYYVHPQTGVPTPYVADDKIIMLSSQARLDLTFGAVPLIGDPPRDALRFLPTRVSDGGRGLDMTLNAWFQPDRTGVNLSVACRPLTVPTEIDSFACLDVVTA